MDKKYTKAEYIFFICIVICLGVFVNAYTTKGKYKIVHSNEGMIYLLDSANGKSWRQITLFDNNKELYDVYWEPMNRLDYYEDIMGHREAFDKHNQSLKKK